MRRSRPGKAPSPSNSTSQTSAPLLNFEFGWHRGGGQPLIRRSYWKNALRHAVLNGKEVGWPLFSSRLPRNS